GMVPLLVAWKPGREDACEVYCRIGSPTPRVLHRLFAGASSAGHLPIAADCLAFLARVPADGLWPRFRLGVSFAFTADGVTLTLFAHANQIFPSAATAHRRIAELGRQLAAPLPVYEAISRRIALERLAEVAHGMVGMKMLGDGRIALAVGVSAGDLTRTR
ncbi:MAG TPA: hypothetical protein VK196_08515, partial [Magnetospirillum sp.]|nr:hypothetical protein [Magnetospirillum sp.]